MLLYGQHTCGQLTFLGICFGVVRYIIQDYLRVESFHLLSSAAALASIEAMPDLLFKFIYHCAAKRIAG